MPQFIVSGTYWTTLAQVISQIEVGEVFWAHDADHTIIVRILWWAVLDIRVQVFVLIIVIFPLIVRIPTID